MGDILVPIFVMLFVFGFPVAAFIVTRVLRHQERMELLRRGIIPPPDYGNRRSRQAWQQTAAPWTQPTTVVPPQNNAWCNTDDDPQRALFKGIRTAAIGLALLIGLAFIGGTPGSVNFRGGPWLLGGLIPMFVGIAQIIIALLSGAQLPGVQPRVMFVPPPQQPGTPPQPPPNFGPNGAPWQQPQQPGRPRFEELSKPVPPPDTRT